jgi:hypothetical protein
MNALAARYHELTVVWQIDQLARTPWIVPERTCSTWRERRHPDQDAESGPTRARFPRALGKRLQPNIVQGMNLVAQGWTAAAVGELSRAEQL